VPSGQRERRARPSSRASCLGVAVGRAPVTTRTTREPGSMWPRPDRFDERAERSNRLEWSGVTPVLSARSAVCFTISSSATAITPPPVVRAAPSARSPCDGSPTASDVICVEASTREIRRSSANASAIGLEAECLTGETSAARARQRARRALLSAKPCASFEKSVPFAAAQMTASGSSQSSCSAISNEIVLRAFARVCVEVAVDEAPREEQPELELETAAVLVGAVHCEDARAWMAGGHRRGLATDRCEHDRLQSRRGGGGRDGVTEIPGRGAAERGPPRGRARPKPRSWRPDPCRTSVGFSPSSFRRRSMPSASESRSDRTRGVQPAPKSTRAPAGKRSW